VIPAAELPQFDLVIASQKVFGVSSQAEAPILWWKVAGQKKEYPPKPCSLLHPAIQKRLLNYELAHTEARQGMVIRRYRRKAAAQ
jgi:hypothetical protein